MQDNIKFADACNYLLYDGQEVIKPEDLEEKDVTELALLQGLKGIEAVEKIRDILKGCCVKTANGITYLIIGIENQSDTHYAMAVRNMLYDALNYSSQVSSFAKTHKKKKDITGSEFLSGFTKEDKLEHALAERGNRWENLSFEAIQLLNECLDAKIEMDESTEKGVGNVCKGIEELAAKRELRGRAEGKAEGEDRLSRLVNLLCRQQRYAEIQLVTSDAAKREEYYREYGII